MTRQKKAKKKLSRCRLQDLNSSEQSLYQFLQIFKSQDDPQKSIFKLSLSKFEVESSRSLSKVEKNLFSGKYSKKPWKFIKDVNEAFDYLEGEFSKSSNAYRKVQSYRETFASEMDEYMIDQGYCCGRWHTNKVSLIKCNGTPSCEIGINDTYFYCDSISYCVECFNKLEESIVLFEDLEAEKSLFRKSVLKKSIPESFVKCRGCGKSHHQICELYVPFSCKNFRCKQCCDLQSEPALRASTLPTTECDIFIENFLRKNQLNQDGLLKIRLISTLSKTCKVEESVLECRKCEESYDYKNSSLFAFVSTSNGDITFFVIFFQTYGSECSECIRNSAYISYIDSVNILPSDKRTKIYRMILVGLFKFLKKKGFSRIYLWSCPPRRNQDYVFFCKPANMKLITPDRLSDWYEELFRLGTEHKVIKSYKGILNHAKSQNWKGLEDIPYIEGDLWQDQMRQAVENVRREYEKLSKTLGKTLGIQNDVVAEYNKKGTQPSAQLKKKLNAFENFDRDSRIWEIMMQQFKVYSRLYFVVDLDISTNDGKAKNLKTEKCYSGDRNWINDRVQLVSFYNNYFLQFSTERKSVFSTRVMLYRIFMVEKLCVRCRKKSQSGLSPQLFCEQCQALELEGKPAKLPRRSSENSRVSSPADSGFGSESLFDFDGEDSEDEDCTNFDDLLGEHVDQHLDVITVKNKIK